MKSKSLWLACLCWGAVSPILAADVAFQFSKSIKSPLLKQEELLAFPLDTEVYAATRDDLADLRVRGADGKLVPYLLRKRQTTRARTVRKTWTVPNPSARPLDDGGLEITVGWDEADKHPPPNGLTIVSPLRDFRQRVRVFNSADGGEWEPQGDETAIFDYSRYMDVRSDSVTFPESDRRRFRIVIDDVTIEQQSELLAFTRRLKGAEEIERTERATVDRRPFRIERIEFWREEQHEGVAGDEKTPYPIAGHRVTDDRDKQRTIIEVETRRQPLTSLTLQTSDRNFSRRAVVEAEEEQGATGHWRKIGEGTLSRVDFRTLKREELSIGFPETRSARYRILVDNRDSPPLAVTGIEAEGNTYEIVHLAARDGQTRLHYGTSDAPRAAYDTAAIQELLQSGFHPSPAELGPEKRSVPGAVSFRWSSLFGNPLVLGGVAAVLVTLLGCGLYRAAKRMDQIPESKREV